MNIHDASIHIVVRENTVRHIRHILDLSESVEGDLAVDAFVAFRCAVLVPRGLDKSRSYGIDCFGSNSFTRDLVRKWTAALVTPYTRDEEYACCPA